IVIDAWSFGIFFRELGEIYGAFVNHRTPSVPALPIQYADFAQWQRQLLESGGMSSQVEYWRKQLSGSSPLLNLPTDRPHPPLQSLAGAQLVHGMSRKLSDRLRVFARQQDVTLFMLLLAGFQTVLCRFAGQTDIVVGTPIAGRTRVQTEQLIGCF